MSMERYTWVESAVRISVPRACATRIATRLFPIAVGPTRKITGKLLEHGLAFPISVDENPCGIVIIPPAHPGRAETRPFPYFTRPPWIAIAPPLPRAIDPFPLRSNGDPHRLSSPRTDPFSFLTRPPPTRPGPSLFPL